MKKTTKILITAAAVAAIAGVSGVSYAAWSAGTAGSATVEDQTGSIVMLDSSISATTDLGSKKLVPYDQETDGDQWNATTMAAEMTITLTYTLEEGAVVMMQASSDDAGAKLEYQKSDNSWAKFTTAVEVPGKTIKVRLNSDDEANDMGADYTITFSVALAS